MKKQEGYNLIKESGIISVMRSMEMNKVVKVAEALINGGIKVLEVTMDNDFAIDMLKKLNKEIKNEDIFIGAGTVLDVEAARYAILSGADFIFAPTLNKDVIKLCNRYNIIVIPGVLTPTEMLKAWELGADMVKLFPANSLGPKYLKSIKGPLPQLDILPTGGINLDNISEYFEAGAVAVGVGSSIIDNKSIKNDEYEIINNRARKFVNKIKKIKRN